VIQVPQAADSTLRKKSLQSGQTLEFLLMALPGVALLAIFSYLPLMGIIIAFKEYRPIDGLFEQHRTDLSS
jgi:putative aldouronate transport system permease protein